VGGGSFFFVHHNQKEIKMVYYVVNGVVYFTYREAKEAMEGSE